MKKLLAIIVLTTVAFHGGGQVRKTDIARMQKKLQQANEDTLKVVLHDSLSTYYSDLYPDSTIAAVEANKGLQLAMRIGYLKGKALCLTRLGDISADQFADNAGALAYYLDVKHVFDTIPPTRPEKWLMFSNLAYAYYGLENYRQSLHYDSLRYKLVAKTDTGKIIGCLLSLGAAYDELYFSDKKKYRTYLDSITKYDDRALTLAKAYGDPKRIIEAGANMANTLQYLGNDNKAYNILRAYFVNGNYDGAYKRVPKFLCEAEMVLAKHYKLNKNTDSSAMYALDLLPRALTEKDYYQVVEADSLLSELYFTVGMVDSAYKYSKDEMKYKDTLHNKKATAKVMELGFQEEKRDAEILRRKEEAEQKFWEALEQTGIAMVILALFIVLLILGRKKVSKRTIDFLGTLFLLMMFEFIYLVLHPKIAEWTNHNELVMFLILVGIAGFILEPLHHRMEKWIREKIEHEPAGGPEATQNITKGLEINNRP
jgi:hypothetical protein